jgi:hypothetical protein
MRKSVATLGVLTLLGACSMANDIPLVESDIAVFHKELNAAQFDKIFADSAPDMKSAPSTVPFPQLLAAVHRKLGDFQSGNSVGWNDNVNTNGHFVTVNFSAKYTRGEARETFVYRVDGKSASLAGYNIDSAALITN